MKILLSFLILFCARLDYHCDAFTINSYSKNVKLPSKTIHVLQSMSSPDQEDDNNDSSEPGLNPSQLEWLEKRSEGIDQDGSGQEQTKAEKDHEAAEKLSGNVNVPKTGISINDQMTELQNTEKFVTRLFPLDKNGVAAIQTMAADTTSDEPMRYLVPLNVYDDVGGDNDDDSESDVEADQQEVAATEKIYALIDLPPFSEGLATQIKTFLGENGSLSHILLTCRNGIHYDEAPAVYVTRKSDMQAWKKAFPSVNIVMYRLDIPRDCKSLVTQTLDGYGPWALEDESGRFNETGRPLTVMEWDEDTQASVLDDGEIPPDDEDEDLNDAALYTPEAIKKREFSKDILAIYTPGHTYGSVTYIFPQSKVCCSGFTIPVEDTRASASAVGIPMGAGPKLDYSGYLTTSVGIDRQIESARFIASVYNDRFEIVLPARGPPVSLGGYSIEERSRILHDMLSEFAELGRVYSSMGIL